MGDTGSLALGGFVAGTAYMLQMPLFIILVGLVYVVEVLSVMIQVTYFKATHGKAFLQNGSYSSIILSCADGLKPESWQYSPL